MRQAWFLIWDGRYRHNPEKIKEDIQRKAEKFNVNLKWRKEIIDTIDGIEELADISGDPVNISEFLDYAELCI